MLRLKYSMKKFLILVKWEDYKNRNEDIKKMQEWWDSNSHLMTGPSYTSLLSEAMFSVDPTADFPKSYQSFYTRIITNHVDKYPTISDLRFLFKDPNSANESTIIDESNCQKIHAEYYWWPSYVLYLAKYLRGCQGRKCVGPPPNRAEEDFPKLLALLDSSPYIGSAKRPIWNFYHCEKTFTQYQWEHSFVDYIIGWNQPGLISWEDRHGRGRVPDEE